jgi:peptidoglycan lytic transglycosylase
MKTTGRRLKYFFFGAGWLSLLLLFQNMTHVDYSQRELPKVNEQTRLGPPQELLLRQKNKSSPVQRIEGKYNLQYHIYSKIRLSLPEKYKAKADEITAAIIEESEKQGLDPVFTLAVIQTESAFNPNAKGKLGDSGLMQILPETAKWIAETYDIPWEGKKALFDPVYNIKIGTAYFAHLRSEFDDVPKDYARAYNSGLTAISKEQVKKVADQKQTPHKAINGHILNRIYARKVMKNYALLYKSFGQTMGPKSKRVAVSNN